MSAGLVASALVELPTLLVKTLDGKVIPIMAEQSNTFDDIKYKVRRQLAARRFN